MEGTAPTTRCKFQVVSVTTGVPGSSTRIRLECRYPSVDVDGFEHGEDHAFFKATPNGHVELDVQNPAGAELFQPGEYVYGDFSAAPRPS